MLVGFLHVCTSSTTIISNLFFDLGSVNALIISVERSVSIFVTTKNSSIRFFKSDNLSCILPLIILPVRLLTLSPKILHDKSVCRSISYFQLYLSVFIPQTIKQ